MTAQIKAMAELKNFLRPGKVGEDEAAIAPTSSL